VRVTFENIWYIYIFSDLYRIEQCRGVNKLLFAVTASSMSSATCVDEL
jgi:hypothetical protein